MVQQGAVGAPGAPQAMAPMYGIPPEDIVTKEELMQVWGQLQQLRQDLAALADSYCQSMKEVNDAFG